jgi:hypothetical protein
MVARVGFAEAHLSDDEAVAKMGHPGVVVKMDPSSRDRSAILGG